MAARPRQFDGVVFGEIEKELHEDVMRWLSEDSEQDAEVRASVIHALEESSMILDGYQICKRLQDIYGWSPDEELVEIFSRAAGMELDAYKRRVKNWVKEHDILPKNKVGDEVKVSTFGAVHKGFIVAIHADEAKYTVRVPELGHKEPGNNGSGTYGFVKTYEEIEQLQEKT